LGLAVAWLSYHRSKLRPANGTFFSYPIWPLFLLRALAVSLIAMLLLAPVVKSVLERIEKPVVVIAIDQSQSILTANDSSYYSGKMLKDIDKLKEKLSDNYRVDQVCFGSEVGDCKQLKYTQRQTNLELLYEEIYNRYDNKNLGAIITLTDGIYNAGQNPLYTVRKINAPFYYLALGDTLPKMDLIVKEVQANTVVYSGNSFPIQVQVAANGLSGKVCKLSLTHNGKTEYQKEISINNGKYFTRETIRLTANQPGLQRYHISLSPIVNEITLQNNEADVYIEVLQSKKRILTVAAAPHPDLAALRSMATRGGKYEMDIMTLSEYNAKINNNPNKLKEYQLVILHQIPGSGQNSDNLMEALAQAQLPIWYIISNQSNLGALTKFSAPISISGSGNSQNDAQAVYSSGFGLFSISQSALDALTIYPPIQTPFGQYTNAGDALLNQKIGKVQSSMPLLTFGNNGSIKTACLAGTGIWRWPMALYAKNQNFDAVDELVQKTIQYLSTVTDNRLFRVRSTKTIYSDEDRISLEAELYNAAFDPVKNAIINLSIKPDKGVDIKLQMLGMGDRYLADAGLLSPGHYSWSSNTIQNGKTLTAQGEFLVKKTEIEYLNTEANYSLMRAIAAQQGGLVLPVRNMDKLPEALSANNQLKPIAYTDTDYQAIMHYKWLFFIILALLAAEWFLRKYLGSY